MERRQLGAPRLLGRQPHRLGYRRHGEPALHGRAAGDRTVGAPRGAGGAGRDSKAAPSTAWPSPSSAAAPPGITPASNSGGFANSSGAAKRNCVTIPVQAGMIRAASPQSAAAGRTGFPRIRSTIPRSHLSCWPLLLSPFHCPRTRFPECAHCRLPILRSRCGCVNSTAYPPMSPRLRTGSHLRNWRALRVSEPTSCVSAGSSAVRRCGCCCPANWASIPRRAIAPRRARPPGTRTSAHARLQCVAHARHRSDRHRARPASGQSASASISNAWTETLNADGLARKFLTERERTALAPLDADARRRDFLRLWTCKEAMSKATGDALMAPFREIDVSDDDGLQLSAGPPPYTPEHWQLFAPHVADDLLATVAVWHDQKSASRSDDRGRRLGAASADLAIFHLFWNHSQSAGLSRTSRSRLRAYRSTIISLASRFVGRIGEDRQAHRIVARGARGASSRTTPSRRGTARSCPRP